jgi:hypothetical protein
MTRRTFHGPPTQTPATTLMLKVPHICAGLIHGFYSSLALGRGAGLAHLALEPAFSNDSSDFFKGA